MTTRLFHFPTCPKHSPYPGTRQPRPTPPPRRNPPDDATCDPRSVGHPREPGFGRLGACRLSTAVALPVDTTPIRCEIECHTRSPVRGRVSVGVDSLEPNLTRRPQRPPGKRRTMLPSILRPCARCGRGGSRPTTAIRKFRPELAWRAAPFAHPDPRAWRGRNREDFKWDRPPAPTAVQTPPARFDIDEPVTARTPGLAGLYGAPQISRLTCKPMPDKLAAGPTGRDGGVVRTCPILVRQVAVRTNGSAGNSPTRQAKVRGCRALSDHNECSRQSDRRQGHTRHQSGRLVSSVSP